MLDVLRSGRSGNGVFYIIPNRQRGKGSPIASPICGEHGIQEDTPASRAQFGCGGAEPPAPAWGNWGYDLWSCQKWPKLWADPSPA